MRNSRHSWEPKMPKGCAMRDLATVLLAGGLALAAVIGSHAPSHAGWTEIRASQNGHFIATAHINGQPVRAIIDTGATVVAIPHEQAQRMGLNPAFLRHDQPLWTANGKVMAARTILRQVEIDGVIVRDVEAVVVPEGALQHVLIGMSYLGKLRRYAVNAGVMQLVK